MILTLFFFPVETESGRTRLSENFRLLAAR
jgi:hypothetical protein